MSSSQNIQQTYDYFSASYDLVFKPWLESGIEKAIKILCPPPGAQILEIGIGTGLSLDYYPKDVCLTAFDYSQGMLRKSKNKLEQKHGFQASLLQMDVHQMAFADNSFDYILAAYVLTVVENLEKAVKEIFRIARPGARVVLINHLCSNNLLVRAIENLLNPIFSRIGLFTLGRDLIGILNDNGAENIEVEPSTFLRLHHIISFNVPLG